MDFITEDGIVNWVLERNGILHTRKVSNINTKDLSVCQKNTLVCLTGYENIVQNFFDKIINKFTKSIILITLETDGFTLKNKYLEHPLLNHWYTWNKPFNHVKITCIPIGINYDRHFLALSNYFERKIQNIINIKTTDNLEKQLLINLNENTNSFRKELVRKGRTEWHNFCDVINYDGYEKVYYQNSIIDGKIRIMTTKSEYYDLLSKYKFILSPPGAGEDCHRTWEALYVGVIPIVIENAISELYTDLPICIVKNWNDINKDFLEKEYIKISNNKRQNKYDMDKIYLSYWKNKFLNIDVKNIL